MYIQKLRLKDVKTMEVAEITFQTPQHGGSDQLPNLTLLVGVNGSGKTTILRAIALAAIGPVLHSSGFVPRGLARRTEGEDPRVGHISAHFHLGRDDGNLGEWNSTLSIRPPTRGWIDRVMPATDPPWVDAMLDEAGPGFFVVGYGANRRVETGRQAAQSIGEKDRHLRYQRVAGLFEESVPLRSLSSWFPLWADEQGRRDVIELVNEVVGVRVFEEEEYGEYLFEIEALRAPFDTLSDGHRAFVGWVADLLFHITRALPSTVRVREATGIVLIDEVDLHMHPQWQREILPRLASAMPRLQFICTTHSPLVVGSVSRHNVLILNQHQGRTRIERPEVEVHGLSSDQILSSLSFGLAGTRAPSFEKKLAEVADLARRGNAEAAKMYLRMLTLGEAALTESDDPPPGGPGDPNDPPPTGTPTGEATREKASGSAAPTSQVYSVQTPETAQPEELGSFKWPSHKPTTLKELEVAVTIGIGENKK